ncbi:uncharacterized protein LOC111628933 [Centruroides sculpturatus]|uniref:uncharacterized protein LOC111628933 n=1 Tax=Centruroides sculpturatus TaxID=218467 RepID=UPI000C6E9E87|nr:uncharacterized protein LOC111628933 [Centruroides sculpturatus]XP_023228560.1 uncharacterized protein LOC111628933 [Centruroides sculpturatus]
MSLLRNVHRPYCHLDDEDEAIRKRYQELRMKRRWYQKAKVTLITVALMVVLLAMAGVTLCFVLPWKDGFNTLRLTPDAKSSNGGGFEDALLVKTNCGQYAGVVEEGAFVFKGIPYAVPPVGDLRWKKTVPIWTDTKHCSNTSRQRAHQFSPPCFQLSPYNKKYKGQEDCLYLNIWSPRLDSSADLEVMVWIHGGFLQFGAGNRPGLCPSAKLAKKLNMVFVSLNYRLHSLGFMALDLLVGSILADGFGNYGLWDMIVALQWIQDNIKNFGGDPKKITVFGPDAGASSILAMISSKVGRELFRSAWLIGPAAIFNRTFEELQKHNTAFFLARSGCRDVKCLKQMSSKEILLSYLGKDDPSFRIRDQNDLPIQGIYPEQLIVVDGDILPATPFETINMGQANDLPLLIGTGSQSVDIWPGPEDLSLWTWNQLRKYVTTSLDSFDPRISQMALHLYNDTDVEDELYTPERLYTTMVTDLRQTCPVKDLASMLAKSFQSPIHRYIVTSIPSKPVRVYDYNSRYSFHMWEAIAFLDQLEHFLKEPTAEDYAFRDSIQNAVTSFVRSGGVTATSGWCSYPDCIALISNNITYVESYQRRQCKFWSSQGLTDYAWVS